MAEWRFFRFLTTAGWIGGGSVMLSMILLAITIWEHLHDKNVAAFVLGILVVVFFCFGAYIAWSKESEKYLNEKQKHEQPDFKLTLYDVLTSYNPTMDLTTICMSGVLTNRGAPSVATGWRARYQSPQIDTSIGHSNLPTEEYDWTLSDGNIVVLKRRELLPAKTLKVISKGESAHGRIIFEFQGDRRHELNNGTAQIWLGCYDFTGRLTQEVFKGGNPIPYGYFFPDEETRQSPLLPST